jgi:hypothetical protein
MAVVDHQGNPLQGKSGREVVEADGIFRCVRSRLISLSQLAAEGSNQRPFQAKELRFSPSAAKPRPTCCQQLRLTRYVPSTKYYY